MGINVSTRINLGQCISIIVNNDRIVAVVGMANAQKIPNTSFWVTFSRKQCARGILSWKRNNE